MLDLIIRWATRRRAARVETPTVVLSPVPARSRVFVAYPTFYGYLEKRYADLVVLTFGQIEDLLGSKLPETARTHAEWWTHPVPTTAPYADAWRLAGRSASPNLLAQNVAFERIASPPVGLTPLAAASTP